MTVTENHLKLPHEYSKRILLVIIGMTPQIITETLYKLAAASEPKYVPTEIHLITTKEGAKSAKLALLGVEQGAGWFDQFCSDYDCSDIQFNDHNIHVISDTEGQFINDNQSTEQNKVASDFITNKIHEFTKEKDSSLHVSLAGGRKTMSFYAGYALSLYGRTQDRLSHVLVNLPFQNNEHFFYPRPTPERLEINGQYYSTEDARIILSDIPFVRMRYMVPEKMLAGQAGYQETVDFIQRFTEPETVELDCEKQTLYCNDVAIVLGDAEFAFYLWMCKRKQDEKPALELEADDFMSDYLDVYSRFTNTNGGMYERAETVAKERNISDQKAWFSQRKSKVKSTIEAVLGKRFAAQFIIQNEGPKGNTSYEVGLSANAIHVR